MRLNAAVREEITKNATKTLQERKKALLLREHALCLECYRVALGPKLLELVTALEAENSNWLDHTVHLAFNVAGQHIKLRAETHLPTPHFYQNYNTLGKPITMDKHRPLVERVQAYTNDWAQFEKDKERAETTLKTVLKSVGSTESLFKVWPEGKKFYSSPPLTPIVKTGVPAVQMQALNEMLGLS